jgi:hypothetical protein
MRIPRRRPVLAALTALALTVPLAATLTPAAAAELPAVKINEIESSGGTGVADWIEIVNTGATAADVSGWVVKDNDDTRTFALPAGTVLAPGALFAIDVDVDGGFGLGGADSARVYLADGTTLVDGYTWAAHAPGTTYGRVPDGTGAFVVTGAASRGTANVAPAPVVPAVRINEIESSGGTGVADWIEIVNTGSTAADVSGWVLKDSDDARTFAIPAGTVLAPGAYFAIDVDVTGGFGLGGADSARLYTAGGTTLVDSYSWTEHAPGTTYGRFPNGTGSFVVTSLATRGAANQAPAPVLPAIRINEVETSSGTPGDWVEFYNSGTAAFDLGGYYFKDNDVTRTFTFPAGTSVPAGGYYVAEEAQFVFGLGTADSARLIAPDNTTVIDERSWTAHSPTTLSVCGTEFVVSTSSTKGAVNDCSLPIRINEVESKDGTPGDWVELKNNGASVVDLSGYVVRDNKDDSTFVVPSGTTVAAGGYYVADVEAAFGLGGADSARLFAADGTTLIDSYTWAEHASTTYGRCADGTGDFATTRESTRGAANACVGDLVTAPWPGSADVSAVDVNGTFASNMSGLAYEAASAGDVLWAARNGVGALFRLVSDGTNWVPDTTNGWGAGKALHYADGTGDVDAEGVAFTGAGSSAGIFIASERNNGGGGSRPSVLRYDASAAGSSLNATMEWNLTADLPVLGANAGLEGIAWVPDSYLVGGGFLDEATGAAYNPASYADHGDGLFFVGVEQNGTVYAYALNQTTGGYTRVATISSGFPAVMELEFDVENQALWAVCDDGCAGRSAILDISQEGATDGTFVVGTVYERPAGMANLNNEGFTLAPQAQCVEGAKPVFWSDDSSTGGFAIREGSIDCTVPTTPVDPTDPTTPVDPTVPAPGNPGATSPVAEAAFTEAARGSVSAPASAVAGSTITVSVGTQFAGDTVNVWLHSAPVLLATRTVAADGTVRVVIPANTPAGVHRIAVLAADGTLLGWDTITITAGGALAYTGADLNAPIRAALILLLAGAGLLVLRRRQQAA